MTNKMAGNGGYEKNISTLKSLYHEPLIFQEVTQIANYRKFLDGLRPDDFLILAGGDGTLNHFINNTAGMRLPEKLLYFPIGTGNDFARELGRAYGDAPFPIRWYLENLPTVEVNGQKRRFLNGVGYGIDGYCTEKGDQLRRKGNRKVNYTAIAIKGLLFHYRPTAASVTVDGREYTYEKVWLAPTMFGKCYGGGMIPTPRQDRNAASPSLSVMIFHSSGKLRTLMIFPSIFKGEHVKHRNVVDVLSGREITVKFDRPTPLQIDGETIRNVTSYHAEAGTAARSNACVGAESIPAARFRPA